MESISDRIRLVARTVRAPTHLKSDIMNAAQQFTPSHTPPSPYAPRASIRILAMVSTLCLIIVVGIRGYVSNHQNTIPNTPLLSVADDIISASIATRDTSWNDASSFENQLQSVSDLFINDAVSIRNTHSMG